MFFLIFQKLAYKSFHWETFSDYDSLAFYYPMTKPSFMEARGELGRGVRSSDALGGCPVELRMWIRISSSPSNACSSERNTVFGYVPSVFTKL